MYLANSLERVKKFCLGAQFTHFTGAVEKHTYELSTWSLAEHLWETECYIVMAVMQNCAIY